MRVFVVGSHGWKALRAPQSQGKPVTKLLKVRYLGVVRSQRERCRIVRVRSRCQVQKSRAARSGRAGQVLELSGSRGDDPPQACSRAAADPRPPSCERAK
jgi:hypothetical protein